MNCGAAGGGSGGRQAEEGNSEGEEERVVMVRGATVEMLKELEKRLLLVMETGEHGESATGGGAAWPPGPSKHAGAEEEVRAQLTAAGAGGRLLEAAGSCATREPGTAFARLAAEVCSENGLLVRTTMAWGCCWSRGRCSTTWPPLTGTAEAGSLSRIPVTPATGS